jgi:spore maturation protein CgeB
VSKRLKVVIFGLSVTSSWGNGHATTYRSLIRGLAKRGHDVLFLERDQPWYAGNRDEPRPAGTVTVLYDSIDELTSRFERHVRDADLVIVGSYVPEGARVGEWVTSIARGKTAFYDIDTPVTLSNLKCGKGDYITTALVSKYNCYLSFTGGPTLRLLETTYGSPMARVLYCSVDPEKYSRVARPIRWDLAYLGTYSEDRQPTLDALLLEPARQSRNRRFAVAGPMYPDSIAWPSNVERITHLSPREHPAFYGSQRFTLNVTRDAMKAAGYSPSVRLFEAGACGVPIISDWWPGLDEVFKIGKEILVAEGPEDALRYIRDLTDAQRFALAEAARVRVLSEHSPKQRALELESYIREMNDHVLIGTPRRHRRGGEDHSRLAIGLAP